MKPYLVKFWHGEPNPNSLFYKRIMQLVRSFKKEGDDNLYFDGSLDAFEEFWQSKFLYFPATEAESNFIAGTIYVTPHSSFNPR